MNARNQSHGEQTGRHVQSRVRLLRLGEPFREIGVPAIFSCFPPARSSGRRSSGAVAPRGQSASSSRIPPQSTPIRPSSCGRSPDPFGNRMQRYQNVRSVDGAIDINGGSSRAREGVSGSSIVSGGVDRTEPPIHLSTSVAYRSGIPPRRQFRSMRRPRSWRPEGWQRRRSSERRPE